MEHYGEILKKEREKINMSRREAASQAGMSEGHLRFIEKGERETTPNKLQRLASILGIDEKGLLEAWLKVHMPAMDYSGLAASLPRGFDLRELEEVYSIDQAKKTYERSKDLTVAQISQVSSKEFIQMRTALQNCLNLIREFEEASL